MPRNLRGTRPADACCCTSIIATPVTESPESPVWMERWIRNPEAVKPGTAMPNAQVTEADARDMVAYLYRLR